MTISIRELPKHLARNYIAGINTFITGRPGLGKTGVITDFATKMKARLAQTGASFTLWTFYAPTMSPMDIQATAPNKETGLLEFYNNAALPNAYTTPDVEGVLFLGELPNADQATTKLLQKYINGEDMNGCLRKPDGVRVIADGNRLQDKSGVIQQGRAFLQRFMHLEVDETADDAISYMISSGWNHNVVAFLKNNPALIDNYESVFGGRSGASTAAEEARSGIWANKRSWKRVSDIETVLVGSADQTVTLDEVAGNVGSGVAAQYVAFKAILSRLASMEEIVAKPKTVPIPSQMDEMYALAMMVSVRATPATLTQVITFGQRLPHELQVVMLRTLQDSPATRKVVLSNAAFTGWLADPKIYALLTSA